MANVEKSNTINSIAVGAIARVINKKNNFLNVTGMVKISDEGNMFELEILGIQRMCEEKLQKFYQHYGMNNSNDEEIKIGGKYLWKLYTILSSQGGVSPEKSFA